MITRRDTLQWGAGLGLLGAWPPNARASAARVLTGPAFGTAWRLVMPDSGDAGAVRRRVEQVVARIDALMSPFRPDSELAHFNARGTARLSAPTAHVTRAALSLARASGGALDPTCAPLLRRYGFGAPTISSARPAGRWSDLRLEGEVLRALRPGLSLDLCAVAKGYALDEIVRALDGVDFLLELGGEIGARGRHPSGRRWRLGVERPGSEQLQRVIEGDGRALATSGDSAQSYVVGTRRYAHVMDPRRGAPVGGDVASVSVLAESGLLADGLATAAMVLGPDAARPLLKRCDACALFLLRRPDGVQEVAVGDFPGARP